ncbi:hypothetical protein GC169_03875 [bacterium]|nr:hypothetical protein [bacterium]
MNADVARAGELWEPRRALSLSQARRRTDLVHLLRALFTIGAATAAGILIGFVVASIATSGQVRADVPAVGVTMLNPRFDGANSSGEAYVVTADTARRRRENVSIVDLVNPRLQTGDQTTVVSREGVYDRDLQVLDLKDDVILTDASGYEFRTTTARMFIRENRIEGSVPLRGVGPIGEVVGDTYEVSDGGNRIVLQGNVWSRIDPDARKSDKGAR